MTDQAALKKRLDVLVKSGENRFCADCGKRGDARFRFYFEVSFCGLNRSPSVLLSADA